MQRDTRARFQASPQYKALIESMEKERLEKVAETAQLAASAERKRSDAWKIAENAMGTKTETQKLKEAAEAQYLASEAFNVAQKAVLATLRPEARSAAVADLAKRKAEAALAPRLLSKAQNALGETKKLEEDYKNVQAAEAQAPQVAVKKESFISRVIKIFTPSKPPAVPASVEPERPKVMKAVAPPKTSDSVPISKNFVSGLKTEKSLGNLAKKPEKKEKTIENVTTTRKRHTRK